LSLGVLKGGRDRVHGGEWQAYTSASVEWEARYCKRASRSNEFWKERAGERNTRLGVRKTKAEFSPS
jgi:hypothetical protein